MLELEDAVSELARGTFTAMAFAKHGVSVVRFVRGGHWGVNGIDGEWEGCSSIELSCFPMMDLKVLEYGFVLAEE